MGVILIAEISFGWTSRRSRNNECTQSIYHRAISLLVHMASFGLGDWLLIVHVGVLNATHTHPDYHKRNRNWATDCSLLLWVLIMTRTPFEEGWDAGIRGYEDPRVICPYANMTKEWKEWHSFYRMAVMYRDEHLAQKDRGDGRHMTHTGKGLALCAIVGGSIGYFVDNPYIAAPLCFLAGVATGALWDRFHKGA